MVNSTEGGNVTVMKTLLSANIRKEIIAITSANILFCITPSLSNILILIALRKATSIHPPTKLLFQCLAITDLGVGLISQPLMVTLMLPADNIDIKIWYMCYYLFWSLSATFCGVSVFASTALSVDRLLALFSGIRYRQVVTLKRVRAVLASGCLTALLTVLVWYFRAESARSIIIIFSTLSLIISLFSYTKIVLRLGQHQSSVQDNVQQGQANKGGIPLLNLERYKRTVVSIALVQLALIACYLPFVICHILYDLNRFPSRFNFLLDLTVTLLFINSSLNPFLYCWRIKEIRQAVKATIKRFCSCPSRGTSTLSTNQ